MIGITDPRKSKPETLWNLKFCPTPQRNLKICNHPMRINSLLSKVPPNEHTIKDGWSPFQKLLNSISFNLFICNIFSVLMFWQLPRLSANIPSKKPAPTHATLHPHLSLSMKTKNIDNLLNYSPFTCSKLTINNRNTTTRCEICSKLTISSHNDVWMVTKCWSLNINTWIKLQLTCLLSTIYKIC